MAHDPAKSDLRPPSPVVLAVPVAAKICTLNDRMSWKAELGPKRKWRDAAEAAAIAWDPERYDPLPGRWYLRISYPVTQPNRRRDPHNWIRTSKWLIDGLVLSGLLADDDSDHVIVLDAAFHPAKDCAAVIVRLAPTLEEMP